MNTTISDPRPQTSARSRVSARSSYEPRPLLPWADTGPLATTTDEIEFFRQLEFSAGGTEGDFRRADMTAVLNALRAGLAFGELLDLTPGLRPTALYGAYLTLERSRAASADAWRTIVACPSREVMQMHGASAERLLPVIVQRLSVKAAIHRGELPAAVAWFDADLTATTAAVIRIEDELDRCDEGSDRAYRLSRQLYDPFGESLFFHDHFLPGRVGALDPHRVAALLDERPVRGRTTTRDS